LEDIFLSKEKVVQLFEIVLDIYGLKERTVWEWYLEAEEWFATLSELMLDNNLQEITVLPTINHISTFVAENYNFFDTKKY